MMQVMRIFGPNLWGWVADHTRRRVLVLRMTSVAAAAIFTGMFWGESFAYFFVLLIVLNLFTSAQGPLSEAQMLSAMHGDLTHYGRLRLWGSVGFIFAVMVSGQLLDAFGITLMPTIALLLLLLVVVAAAGMREEVQQVHPHAMPSVRALLKQREVLSFFASTFLMVAAHAALYVYFSLYLAQIGYSKTVIGMMWSLGVIAEILFFYWQAPIFRRYSLRALMLLSLAVGVTICTDRLCCRLIAAVVICPVTSRRDFRRASFSLGGCTAALVCRAFTGARAGALHQCVLRLGR